MQRPGGGQLELLTFSALGPGVTAVVTTRRGGVSEGPYASLNLGDHVGDDHQAVLENRRRACAAVGVDVLTVADQQHGRGVAVVDEGLVGAGGLDHADAQARLGSVDGMVTVVPGAALTVLVADCQPVVLWSPAARLLGVAHAGRGGTLLGVVPAVVDAMAGLGAAASDLRVGIGPHISGASYEVPAGLAADIDERYPTLGATSTTREGHATIDLERVVVHQLVAAGVPPDHIETICVDTLHATDLFFSDRAQRP